MSRQPVWDDEFDQLRRERFARREPSRPPGGGGRRFWRRFLTSLFVLTAAAAAALVLYSQRDSLGIPWFEPGPPAAISQQLAALDESTLIYGRGIADGAVVTGRGVLPSGGGTPWEILLPSARMRADLVRIGVTSSGALGSPADPFVIGWWDGGPAPGERGNVLLDGHRDFTDVSGRKGAGVCWELPEVRRGDLLLIRDHAAALQYVYEVREATAITWNDPQAPRYLEPSADATLTLVTCEGTYDGAVDNYSHRRVVVARLVDTMPFAA